MLGSAFSFHVGDVEAAGLTSKMDDEGLCASRKVVLSHVHTPCLVELAGVS